VIEKGIVGCFGGWGMGEERDVVVWRMTEEMPPRYFEWAGISLESDH
jgi:hypothetical protein